jgi:hypothetical protein
MIEDFVGWAFVVFVIFCVIIVVLVASAVFL